MINVEFCQKYIKLSNGNVNKIIEFDSKIKCFEMLLMVKEQNKFGYSGHLIQWLIKK